MAIDIQSIETLSQVAIGCDLEEPLLANDSLKATFIVAEGVDAAGVPVNPALFASDNGGWVGVVEVVEGTLPLTIDNPLADDGELTLRMAPDLSTPQTCIANVKVTNAALPAKRTVFRVTLTVVAEDPVP